MVGNSNSPMTTFRRLPKSRALATELIPAEALATTATSSGSAPMKRAKAARAFSYSSTHRSQGEPSSCHERMWACREASTASLSAPCEQEFRKILFLKMGNCARICWTLVEVYETKVRLKYKSTKVHLDLLRGPGKNGSERESVRTHILRGFLQSDEFGLGGRQALRLQEQVVHVAIASATPEQRFDVAVDGFDHAHWDLGPAVVQDALQMIQ